MKKLFKILLYILGAIASLVLLAVVWWNVRSYFKQKQEAKDLFSVGKKCDTMKVVTESPYLGFVGFRSDEVNALKFEIIRNGKSVKDSAVFAEKKRLDSEYISYYIPFQNFLKTDTIRITTKKGRKFNVSNFQYNAAARHGMFGYLFTECVLLSDVTVNSVKTDGVIKPELAEN